MTPRKRYAIQRPQVDPHEDLRARSALPLFDAEEPIRVLVSSPVGPAGSVPPESRSVACAAIARLVACDCRIISNRDKPAVVQRLAEELKVPLDLPDNAQTYELEQQIGAAVRKVQKDFAQLVETPSSVEGVKAYRAHFMRLINRKDAKALIRPFVNGDLGASPRDAGAAAGAGLRAARALPPAGAVVFGEAATGTDSCCGAGSCCG
jgi:hypothetical protein